MKIKNNIEKFLEEERQLSEYKLQLLKAGESKQYIFLFNILNNG